MRTFTPQDIKNYNPCSRYTDKYIDKLFAGRNTITMLDVLEMDIPPEDIIWLFSCPNAATELQQRVFACMCAQSVLDIWEKHYPADNRPQQAIESAYEYAHGRIRDAAWAAASDAARDAAWAAASDAVWAAASDAAWAAASDAARDAAWAARAAASDAARDAAWAARDAASELHLIFISEVLTEYK